MAYTIQSGDTLSEIAEKNNTSVAEIMASNPQIKDANKIQAGASLNISSAGSGAPTYQGGFGTESGGSSQERAREIVGDDRANELAKLSQQNYTPAQARQAQLQTGLRVGEVNYDQALGMTDARYNPYNTKDMVIGGILGAVIPGAGLLYNAAKYGEAAQNRRIGEQLTLQGEYEPTGIFGTGLFKGPQAASYVPIYDENDNLVGSLGLDEAGEAVRYTGKRDEDYTGLGEEFISRVPEPPEFDDDDGPSPVSAEAVGVKPEETPGSGYRPPAKIPTVPLPSALDQPAPTRPMPQGPVTKPTQIPQGFGQRTAVPTPQGGIMASQAAMQQQQQYPFMYGNEYARQQPQQGQPQRRMA